MINLQFYLIIVLVASSIDLSWSMCQKAAEIDATYGMETNYFGERSLVVPLDQDKLKQHCSTYEDGFKGIQEYSTNCLQGMARSVGLALGKGLHAHFDKQCKDADFGPEFIKHNQCFEDTAKLNEFHQCADRWFHMMDQIKNIPGADSVKCSCCIFHQYQDCIAEKNANLCHDKNVHFWNQALDDMTDETVQMFCGGLNTMEDCNSKFPKDQWATITGPVSSMDAAALESRNKWKSMFFVLVDVLSNHAL